MPAAMFTPVKFDFKVINNDVIERPATLAHLGSFDPKSVHMPFRRIEAKLTIPAESSKRRLLLHGSRIRRSNRSYSRWIAATCFSVRSIRSKRKKL